MIPDPLSLGQVDGPLKIYSRLLDAEIWLVPEGYSGPPLDAPVYSAAECRLLVALQPEALQLRAIHLVREHFAGELVEDLAAGHSAQPQPQDPPAGTSGKAELLTLASRLGPTLNHPEQQDK